MVAKGLLHRFRKIVTGFAGNDRGNAAVIFGMGAIPLMAIAGCAVDYAQFHAAKTHLQSAVDSGALAAANPELPDTGARIAAAEAMYNKNMEKGAASQFGPTATFEIIDGKAVARGEVTVPMTFMTFVSLTSLTATADAEVGIAQKKKAEIVLVLDYSGSMGENIDGGVKYQIMKEAASDLVNDLATAAPDKVKFGLVPFSHHVYTTLPGAHVVGGGAGSWTGCTQDRRYPHNISVSTPAAANATKWGQPHAPEHAGWGCQGYVDNNLRTLDLTQNFDSVTNQLAVMTPYAWTHIALGVEFGYHMLSPNAPFTKGVAFNDGETEKFMVVLTDGMQTEPAFGPGASRNVTQGEKNLEALCESAKGNGITMITMAFDLDDNATSQRLKSCATDPDKHFFVANSADDLSGAFDAVKEAVTAKVYLSK